jgi:hypothetical protein
MDMLGIISGCLVVLGAFVVYTLRKTDVKIDTTATALSNHRIETVAAHANIRADIAREFATKLELSTIEKRLTESNRDIHLKLDKLIDRLIITSPPK